MEIFGNYCHGAKAPAFAAGDATAGWESVVAGSEKYGDFQKDLSETIAGCRYARLKAYFDV